jgi:trk system potassium uptake protein
MLPGHLGSGEASLVELEVSPQLAGRTVNDLTIPQEAMVVSITRGGKTFLPTMGTAFQAGDLVNVAVLAVSADRFQQLLA